MIEVRPLGLDGVFEVVPKKHGDARGFFSEVYNREAFQAAGITPEFVQDNHSFSASRGVLRGLHYQLEPAAQDKLVRVLRGAILDVAVDLRASSPTFGKWVSLEVSAEKWNQIFVPKGFGHGFLTLEDNTEVSYKVSALYAKELDRSIRFDDPTIGIEWPDLGTSLTLSDKDRKAPFLADAQVFT